MTQPLPTAIWLPGEIPTVYSGTPVQIVAEMTAEMYEELTVRETVETLTEALAKNKGVVIGLPADAPDEDLARLFILALLDSGLARTLAAA